VKDMSEKTKCKKCSYEWTTKSKMFHTSCPKCGSRVSLLKKQETKPEISAKEQKDIEAIQKYEENF